MQEIKFIRSKTMIISPLNYSGNKSKILKTLISLFPKDIKTFVDIFCGSGIVGLNAEFKNLILNDKEKHIVNLLQYFQSNSLDYILNQINKIITEYKLTDSKNKPKGFYKIYKNEGLSRYNKEGFLELRKSYNKHPSEIKLFVLILFGFNYFLRFNSKGLFNVPVGKMDFSGSQYKKTIIFIKALQNKNIKLLNLDFRDKALYKSGDFFYFDPPYLITDAPYNALWNEEDEKDLYKILDSLHLKGKKFALSNVLESNGKSNNFLKTWSSKYTVVPIDRQYTNANYRRKNLGKTQEVLILNY